MKKLYKIESQFFAVRFLALISSKHNFTVPIKQVLFSTITTPKSLFYFFVNESKMPKEIPKNAGQL